MYAFTDGQKAALFDAGVTINDVASYYATDDRCIESADEAFDTLIEWYGSDLDYEVEMADRDEGRYLCTNNDITREDGFDYEAHDRAVAGDEALEASVQCWMEREAAAEAEMHRLIDEYVHVPC